MGAIRTSTKKNVTGEKCLILCQVQRKQHRRVASTIFEFQSEVRRTSNVHTRTGNETTLR
jgi:hypothetical protein